MTEPRVLLVLWCPGCESEWPLVLRPGGPRVAVQCPKRCRKVAPTVRFPGGDEAMNRWDGIHRDERFRRDHERAMTAAARDAECDRRYAESRT